MSKRRYEAFTLIEMLVVMGILIILMVVGIAAGRFALFRAADVAHRNAADQLFEGLQAYFVDNRSYPRANNGCFDNDGAPGQQCNPRELMAGPLEPYLDIGAFNGGSDATFIYFSGGDAFNQAALICVTMRGTWSVNYGHSEGAVYCSGNAFNTQITASTEGAIADLEIDTNLIETVQTAGGEVDSGSLFGQFHTALGGGVNTPANGSDWVNNDWAEPIAP